MPCSASDLQRYSDMLIDDLVASSCYALDRRSVSVLHMSRARAVVLLRQALLPADTSCVLVAADFVAQVHGRSANSPATGADYNSSSFSSCAAELLRCGASIRQHTPQSSCAGVSWRLLTYAGVC